MTIVISEPVTFVIAIVIGIGIKSLADLVMEARARRPRRFTQAEAALRAYRDPCGPACTSPSNAAAAERRHETRGLTTAERARIQAVIDAAASRMEAD